LRLLASFQNPAAAQALDQLLSSHDIPTLVRDGDKGGRAVWIVSDQDLPKAQQLLAAFVDHYTAAQKRAQVSSKGLQHRLWTHFLSSPVTWSLLVVSFVVSLYTDLGDNRERVELFTISGPQSAISALGGSDWSVWDDLRAGQLWRLVTPILLHFHPLHLIFNAVGLHDLGSASERVLGARRYAVLLLWSAVASNLLQLVIEGPSFGGLSGVVYAMLGFLWARGHFDRQSGIHLPTTWVLLLVGQMALGFTGVLGPIANYCHLGGFAAGVIYGYIGAMFAQQHEPR
jgi:GlpG protein